MGYQPSDQDILQIQLDTVGIEECRISPYRGLDLDFCDVSGSRGRRQIWSHFFEDGERSSIKLKMRV